MLSIRHPVQDDPLPISPNLAIAGLVSASILFGATLVVLGGRLRGIGHSDLLRDVFMAAISLIMIWVYFQNLRAILRRGQSGPGSISG